MNIKKQILESIEKADYAQAFELMEEHISEDAKHLYNELRHDHIRGSHDIRFAQRLRTFIGSHFLDVENVMPSKQQRPLREFMEDTKKEEGFTYKIVTFYSFKGGAGRSQLLANMAAYMCYHLKKSVLIIDWDLEAPGIDRFFKEAKTQKPFDRTDVTKGLIDFFKSYIDLANKEQNLNEEDLPTLSQDYIHTLVEHTQGKIDFVPAVNYNDAHYTQTVNHLDWFDFYDRLQGRYFIEVLKRQLKSMPYDLILIDSRTGISDYSGICNIQLPDVNVILTVPTDQSIIGAKEVAEKILASPYTQKNRPKAVILPVLSRVETSNGRAQSKWRVEFEKHFKPIITQTLANQRFTDSVDDYISHTYLKHDNELAYGENLLFAPTEQMIVQDSIEEAMLYLFKYMDTQPERNLTQEIADILTTIKQLEKRKADKKTIESFYVDLARLYYENIEFENALAYYEKAMPLIAKNAEDLRKLGRCYAERNDHEKAKELYKKALTLNPNDYKAWYNLGVVYHDLQDYTQAKICYEKAIELEPTHAMAWNNLGNIYGNLQEYAQAKVHHEKAIELEPADARIWNNLGVTYNNLKDYQKAKEAYEEALRLDSNYESAKKNLEKLEKMLKEKQKKVEK